MGHLAILGAGAWGTALARTLSQSETTVRLWTWQEQHAAAMREQRENRQFFPGFELPSAVEPSSDLAECLQDADVVLLVVPTQALRETLNRARDLLPPASALVIASKGIEDDTLMLLTEVVTDTLGASQAQRTAVLSGPSFAKEVALGMPTNLVVASSDHALSVEIQQRCATERLRVYSSDDPIGVQVGGALKNVIAIAAGACDGLGFGHNTRAALITRGLAELARLATAKGGNVLSLSGLAGLGDLILTCTGELSRNRTVGYEMGKGRPLEEVLQALGHVAEGVVTARSAYRLAQRLDVDLPICTEVYRALYEGKPAEDTVRDVLRRPLKRELG